MGLIPTLIANIGSIFKGANTLVEGKGTTRLREDNSSESWLTQSIRPLIAIWVLALSTYVLFVPTVALTVQTLVLALLSDIISFYFIARTTEKVIKEILAKLGKTGK